MDTGLIKDTPMYKIWVILWLSLQLTVTSYFWMKAEKELAYYKGKESVFEGMSAAVDDGTFYLFPLKNPPKIQKP